MSADDPTVSPTETEPALPKVVRVALDKLVLDPNNPRIRDRWSTWPVPRERWASEEVQKEVMRALRGPDDVELWELIMSVGTVGWRDVTLIQGMRLQNGAYLVIDGNCRVAALRLLQSGKILIGEDLNFDAVKKIRTLPIQVVSAYSDSEHYSDQLLRHMVKIKPWRTQVAVETYFDLVEGEAQLPQSLKRLFSILDVRIEDDGDALSVLDQLSNRWGGRIDPERTPAIVAHALQFDEFRKWLDWSSESGRVWNVPNSKRFFGWLIQPPRERVSAITGGRGSGVRRVIPPLLESFDDVRTVARLLADPQRLDHWERQRRAELTMADTTTLARLRGEGASFKLRDAIGEIQAVQASLTTDHLAEIERLVDSLRGVLAARPGERALPQNDRPWDHHVSDADAHLQSLHIPRYRGLTSLSLEGLGRINLLVGANNSGKTSVLEAVSLLIHQSDPRAMLSALRRRARWDITTNPEWLAEELPAPAEVRARFGGVSVREGLWTLTFSTSADPAHADPFDLIGRARTLARFGEAEQRSTMELRVGKAPRFTGEGERRWICPTMSQSPFSTDHELIRKAHEQAVILGVKDRVVQFLREQLDDKLSDIELVENHRFRAPHQARPRSPDLSSFGDGVQRAFQIALMLAGAAGGVLLIDELECAIHTSLLIPFTRLIQELAVELNVQVFITTHSKETVDAFLFNEYRNEDIVAYGLPARGSGEAVRRYVGPSLRKAIDAIDLDIRW